MSVGSISSHGMKIKDRIFKVIFQDCIEGMKTLPEECAELIIADPPFGIGFDGKAGNYNRDSSLVIDGYTDVPKEEYKAFTEDWLIEAKRVLWEHGTMYVFSSWNNLPQLMSTCEALNLYPSNHLIWIKTFPVWRRWSWVHAHYHILVLHKIKPPATGKPEHIHKARYKRHPKKGNLYHYPLDVLYYKEDYMKGKLKNSTKLPDALIKELILTSSDTGDVVLDPFMGNGTTLRVGLRYKRKIVGFEINEQVKPLIEEIVYKYQRGHNDALREFR